MFQVMQINAGSNCYLVSQEDSSILVDTGLKGNEKRIIGACQEKHVRLIVLTHGHIDHIQNAVCLAKQLHVPIAMHEKDIDLIQDNLCREMKSKGFLGNLVRFFSVLNAKHTKVQKFVPEVVLKDGDKLTKYGIDGEIIELPGHTEGSIGILLGDQHLLVGDALMNMIGPSVSLIYENYEMMQNSAKRIENIGKIIIHFGHGRAVENRVWVK